MRHILHCLICVLTIGQISAQHTFSIVAIDAETLEVGSAGATCLTSEDCGGCGGAVIITDLVAGKGGMNAQAQICIPNVNLNNGINKIEDEISANQVLSEVLENDLCQFGGTADRQYGIVTLDESGILDVAGFTGKTNSPFANHIVGPNYAIQGNILIGEEVLIGMEQGFLNTEGSLAEKLMGAMQGANIPGADSRCLMDGISSRSSFLRLLPSTGVTDLGYIDLIVPNTINNVDPIDSLQTLFAERLGMINSVNSLLVGEKSEVFPNPASAYITLKNDNLSSENNQIKFFNNQGRLLNQKEIQSFQISIRDLATGLIFFQVLDDQDRPLQFGKFIIERN